MICDEVITYRVKGQRLLGTSNRQTPSQIILEEDLIFDEGDGKAKLFLRFKNCTGNVIDLTNTEPIVVDPFEMAKSQLTLSVDPTFKEIRCRTVQKVVNMVLRWRTISTGYFDYRINRNVLPMPLSQAATQLDLRHTKLTGECQHIEKKTLDDYFDKIKWGDDTKNIYDFSLNRNESVKHLRKHCESTRQLQPLFDLHN